MSFGYDREPRTLLNNSMVLDAFLYAGDDQTLVPHASIHSVTFSVVKPNNTTSPLVPDLNAVTGTVDTSEDGHGYYAVSSTFNDTEGQYKAIATFTYDDVIDDQINLVKSVPCDYEVSDPFVRAGSSPADPAVRMCWTFLEDCFDSEWGGPWLRDMTLAVFDQTKVRALVPQVLLDINNQMPFTTYSESSFPWTTSGTVDSTDFGDSEALFAQGLLVASLRHLMRSYTEQPDIVSSPVAFMDRKRYQQAWKAQYDVEMEQWKKWLNRWKLQQYDLSHSSLLLYNKAGRFLPGPMRTRNVGRWGGY